MPASPPPPGSDGLPTPNAPDGSTFRVLWLTEHYYPGQGGMAQSCDRIVAGLREAGATIDLVHFTRRARYAGRPIRAETRRNGRYIAVPTGATPAHTLNLLWNAIEADPLTGTLTHIVAFGGELALRAAPIYAAWLELPLITLLRGNDFDLGIFSPRLLPALHQALERAAHVCVVSRDKARKIAGLYRHIQPTWIPNGIDLRTWIPLPSERQRAAAWRRATVGPGRRVLGIFGQIKPKKGGLFFLKALQASGLAERFHLLLVGELDAELHEWLQLHRASAGGEIACTLLPHQERYALLPHYLACDLVVLPSFYDGLPNVALEAAALGIPLLAATTGGMADVLQDGRHGLLFAPGNSHDCRRALNLAARLPAETLQHQGNACRALVENHLHHRLEAERYLRVLAATYPTSVAPESGEAAAHQ